MRNSLSRSPSSILSTGIPVQRSTTDAIWFGRTASSTITSLPAFSAFSSFFSNSGITPYCNSPIRAKSPARFACSNSIRILSSSSFISRAPASLSRSACHLAVIAALSSRSFISSLFKLNKRSLDASSFSNFNASASICFCNNSRSIVSSSSGLLSTSMRNRDAASSIKSMALSGKNLSEMYRSLKIAA